MPLSYSIPPDLQALIASGQAKLYGAIIKDLASGKILGHVQQTQGLVNKFFSVGSVLAGSGFSPLGVIGAVQNEQIKSSLKKLGQDMAFLQNLQVANMALTGVGIGVSVAGFAIMNMRLNAIENHLGTLQEEVREIGRMMQKAELRRLFSKIRAALKDLDSVTTRSDHLGLAGSLQREFSTHASMLADLLREAITPGKAKVLPMERLDLIWTLSSAKWLCEQAELRALFVSEDLGHASEYARHYQGENLRCLDQLNSDSLARLIAASEKDLTASIAKRREAAAHLDRIAEGFANAVNSLDQQHLLALTLVDSGVGGREFVQAAVQETETPFLLVAPGK